MRRNNTFLNNTTQAAYWHQVIASEALSLILPKQKTLISTHPPCIKVHASWNTHDDSTETSPKHSIQKTQTGRFSLPAAVRCTLMASISCPLPSYWVMVLCWPPVSPNTHKISYQCVHRGCIQISSSEGSSTTFCAESMSMYLPWALATRPATLRHLGHQHPIWAAQHWNHSVINMSVWVEKRV